MKKTIFLMVALLSFVSSAHAWVMKTGTYELIGGNNEWGSSTYHGEVVIAPQGDNYSVTWYIGSRQAQVGVGVLQNDVLSVAFVDLANPNFWGVASFKVGPWGELEGRWTGRDGVQQKPERLIWKSYSTY